MALIFNLFISNQNCNSDPSLTKLGFTCVIVLLENKLASNAVILTTSQCYLLVPCDKQRRTMDYYLP